jgi:polyisoprenoid-binding protein YceI
MMGLAILALLAVAAVASASASAAGWTVCKEHAGSGKKFTTNQCNVESGTGKFEDVALAAGETAELAEATKVTASVIKFKAGVIEIKCEEVTVQKGFLVGAFKNEAASITFKKCKVVKPVNCEVTGGEIKTGELESELNAEGTEVTFKPKAPATIFASFKLKSVPEKTCTVAGEYKVKGSTKATIAKPAECLAEHTLTIKEEPSTTLKVGEENIEKFEQVIGVKLASGACFDA